MELNAILGGDKELNASDDPGAVQGLPFKPAKVLSSIANNFFVLSRSTVAI